MPPYKPDQQAYERLSRSAGEIVDKQYLKDTEIPKHRTVATRASAILAQYGQVPVDSTRSGGRNTIYGTPWFENGDLADGGTRVFYRMQRGRKVQGNGGGVSIDSQTYMVLAKITRPGPLRPSEKLSETIEVGGIGERVWHKLNDASILQTGVFMPPASFEGLPVALASTDEAFTVIVDTMEFIAEAAAQAATAY
ncbi:MAG: hypothetical protein WDN27_05760, partial [Candidatus Saccharibacteria bacterium]